MAVYFSRSEEDTLRWARSYAKTLVPGDVVLLEGDMGAGKTVLAKGICKGLGIEAEVTSPTYAYINDYGNVYHFDCYRLPSEEYALSLGFAEYFGKGICLVEWAQNIAGLLPDKVKRVSIRACGEQEREIEF